MIVLLESICQSLKIKSRLYKYYCEWVLYYVMGRHEDISDGVGALKGIGNKNLSKELLKLYVY